MLDLLMYSIVKITIIISNFVKAWKNWTYTEFKYKSKKLSEPWKPANPYSAIAVVYELTISKILNFLWTVIIPIKLPNKKNNKLT